MPAKLTPEEAQAFLDEKPGWIVLSTIDQHGFPHSVPLGYFCHGDHIYCGVRDNTQKIRNIERNDKVAVMVEDGATMADIKGVMVQGRGKVHRDPSKVLELMRLGASARGVAEQDLPAQVSPGTAFIEIVPVRKITWDYGR